MATGRIAYTKTTPIGADLYDVLRKGIEFRKALGELGRKVGRYNDANDAVGTDSGIPDKDVQAFRDMLARAAAELTGDALVKLDPGGQTFTRTLIDSMG